MRWHFHVFRSNCPSVPYPHSGRVKCRPSVLGPSIGITACLLLGMIQYGSAHAAANSAEERRQAVETHLSRYIRLTGQQDGGLSLASEMKRLRVPAVSIAAIQDGRVDWARAYGVSPSGAAIQTSTVFGAASISKAVTAMGVLRLVQDGRLSLDDDVNHYLRRCKLAENQFTAEKKVTVRELLSHTSGIGTHNGEIDDPAKGLPTLVQIFLGEKPAGTAPVRVEAIPGSRFAYANGGYLVLGLLIEDITRERFPDYMKQVVLDPIGMNDSTFENVLPRTYLDRAATPYNNDGVAVPPAQFAEPNLPAGGLWTTPLDLAKFLIEFQREYEGKSNKVLDARMIQSILNPGTFQSKVRPWGLGFEVAGSPDNRYVRHGGSGYFQTDMLLYLHGSGIVVMTNSGGGSALAEELLRSAGTVYGFPDFRAQERAAVNVDPLLLPRFVGTYGFVKVSLRQEGLTAEIPEGTPPQRLYASSPTHFFVLDGPQELDFALDEKQVVTSVEFSTPLVKQALHKTDPK
jgi:CubicO group peptidase (beta-lactamase class C family)